MTADVAPGGVGLVVVAAGLGTRLGAGMPKALVPVGTSPGARPLVSHALDRALETSGLTAVVVVAPPGEGVEQICAALDLSPHASDHGLSRHGTTTHGRIRRSAGISVAVVAGGAERADSVAAGLAALPDDVGIVLVHDAARAFTPTAVFDRVVDAVRSGHAAVIPAVPVVDTIKQVQQDVSGDVETVVSTPDRAGLRAVQTPQGFLRETLQRAHAESRGAVTDDAGMVEALGGRVAVVPGDHRAFKVTTARDLEVAAAMVEEEAGEVDR